MTTLTFVKPLAGIGRHGFGLDEATCRACQRRLQLNSRRRGHLQGLLQGSIHFGGLSTCLD